MKLHLRIGDFRLSSTAWFKHANIMKPFTLCVLLLFLTTMARAQESFTFRPALQPGSTYHLEQTNSSEATMNFTGDDDMIAFMQAKVGKLPVKILNNQTTPVTIRTKGGSKEIPFVAVYGTATRTIETNGQVRKGKNPLEGANIDGVQAADESIHIKGVQGKSVEQQTLAQVGDNLSGMIHFIVFPETPMHLNDTFEQRKPMSIPVVGAEPVPVEFIFHCTLTSVEDSVANFDVRVSVELEEPTDQSGISVTGGGTGKVQFNMQYAYTKLAEINMNATLEMELPTGKSTTQVTHSNKLQTLSGNK